MPGIQVNREHEPAYAGASITFCKAPLALRPEDLTGADVAVVGAPIDEAVSNRPGARYGPRAIRLAVGEICAAGVIPVVLGGDHSIAHPDVGAVADHRPGGTTLGLVHFDA